MVKFGPMCLRYVLINSVMILFQKIMHFSTRFQNAIEFDLLEMARQCSLPCWTLLTLMYYNL